jgi:hypothetical protein
MKINRIHSRWVWLTAGLVVLGATVALNWNTVTFAVAVSSADRRPVLLVDAEWNEPASAYKFLNRFQLGTHESELVGWLESNNFKVDSDAGRATRLIRSLPCNEQIEIKWSRMLNDTLDNVQVLVSEAGCL